jgi:16S rRNA (guanine966-N2)-methyltransferase
VARPHDVAGAGGRVGAECMIRIIAGEFKGRRIKTPASDKVRPTGDRVREAWFNILQGSIEGARVLDLFAGSGALGFEALSRGAVSADFVEKHTPSLATIHDNAASLNVADRVTIHRMDAIRFAERLQPGAYDVAFADPPYATDDVARLVELFRATPFARLFSIEHSIDRVVEGDDTRRYGDTAITFLYPSPSSAVLRRPPAPS